MKNHVVLAGLGLATLLLTGCASVTQGTTHALRIETMTEKGEIVDGADCTLSNDHGTTIAKSGSSSQVRRSSQDLEVTCNQAGQKDAKARLVSRANAGLAGNIILGGAIGAVVDHNTGAAYTYPGWVRLVFGQFSLFDRRDEREGTAMVPPGAVLAQGPSSPAAGVPAAAEGAKPAVFGAVTRGDTFDYRITDRSNGRQQTVVLRAERVENGEVSFNNGTRVESGNGDVVRLTAMIAGELDQITPPGGWLQGGRIPSGSWKMKHRSIVPASGMSYDLDAFAEGEQKMVIDGRELRTVRVGLRGWAENRNPAMTSRAMYHGTAWISPELRRVVRFEAKSRANGNSSANFSIDEAVELVRIGRD